jgi:hypothetical protein
MAEGATKGRTTSGEASVGLARQFSHTCREGLLEFFFDPKSELDSLTRNYGVF